MNLPRIFQVRRPPANEAEIQVLMAVTGTLPKMYVELLKYANGLEACIHDKDGDCLAIWGTAEVVELNDAYMIAKWCPNLLAIGSDGGDDAIGFDRQPGRHPDDWPVVRIGFGNLDPIDYLIVAPNLQAWAENEFRL